MNFGMVGMPEYNSRLNAMLRDRKVMSPDAGFTGLGDSMTQGSFTPAMPGTGTATPAAWQGMTNYFRGLNVQGRFTGGTAPRGRMTRVGEKGPELLHSKNGTRIVGRDGPDFIEPKEDSYVTPNERMQAMPVRQRMGMSAMPNRYRFSSR